MPLSMDFDPKYREKLSSHQPLFFPDNFPKPRDDFSIESAPSSKDTSFLQDLHPFESFNLINGSSSPSNPMFSIQPTCLDPFDNSSLEGLQNFDFYESKPHGGNHIGGSNGSLIPLMDNFNQSGGSVVVLGHSQMVTPINMMNNSSFQTHNHFNYYDLGPTKYLPADEGSCTSLKNDMAMTAKSLSTTTMAKKGGRGRKKKTNVVKGQWTIEEDRLLIQLVERYGIRKWSQIAQMLNGRIGKQCRERWHNHLRPDIKKEVWSEEEDRVLIKAHAEIGNKWAEIAKRLPGRTENSIKNHWNATKRKQFARRKCRSKYPRQSSLLQDYIKSLAPEVINAGCRKKPSSSSSNITTENISKSPKIDHQTGSSDSGSSEELNPPEYDFSEVPDFNFDTQMFEDSSFDSLLEGASNEDNENGVIVYDHGQGNTSSENLNDAHIDLGSIMQCEVKKELDLVEMINQVNL